ncbi:hypothetical protein IQ250_09310 [Pseudanabaenaceae cyanobacterium LEGE 13415]|nr:hypothetical protein [Pseudanabaenaceae cyanobacterium LEGE 13415]
MVSENQFSTTQSSNPQPSMSTSQSEYRPTSSDYRSETNNQPQTNYQPEAKSENSSN